MSAFATHWPLSYDAVFVAAHLCVALLPESTVACCSAAPIALWQVLVELAGQSFRLMALVVGTLRNVEQSELARMEQPQAEQLCSQLELLGLLVLSNHLHPASKDTISHLQDRSITWCLLLACGYLHLCTYDVLQKGACIVPVMTGASSCCRQSTSRGAWTGCRHLCASHH